MKTLVLGANGKIGRIFCRLCAEKGRAVKAMIRDAKQHEYFEKLGIETVLGDLEGAFAPAFEDCNAVVFTAGSGGHTGGDKTLLIDLYAATRAADAAADHGIKHFIMVSALQADNPMLSTRIRHYLVAKKFADEHLMRSGVPYTILRPGRLTDEAASGKIALPEDSTKGGSISRENTARVMLHVLEQGPANKVYNLLDGETDIAGLIV